MNILIFALNPILYIFYKVSNYKNILKMKTEYLLIISFSILNTYIPYNIGDSVRYAFKFYSLRLFPIKIAHDFFLPKTSVLYYNVLHFFSFFNLPYNFFVFTISFIIFWITFIILKNNNIYNRSIFPYFLLIWYPIIIGTVLRFPLSIYICIYGILESEKNKKNIFFILLAIFIHETSIILSFFYFFTKFPINLLVNYI